MFSPFFFLSGSERYLTSRNFFSSKLRVQKLFSYIIRGICDSRVSFRKLEFFPVFPLRALLRKMVTVICQKIRSLGFAYFLTGKMKLNSLELGLVCLLVCLSRPTDLGH